MEANPYSNFVTDFFSGEPCCPQELQGIVSELSGFRAPVVGTTAVALALAAAAVGSRHRVTVGNTQLTAGFHVLVAHRVLRTPFWFEILQARLVTRVVAMQHALRIDGIRGTQRLLEQYQTDLEAARKDPDPEVITRAQREIAALTARLKPEIVLTSAAPKEILTALPNAFDAGVACVTLGSDPLDDLALLRPGERRQLAIWLNTLWNGQVTPGDGPAMLSLLWATPFQRLAHLSRWREFHAGTLPVPLLLLNSLDDPAPDFSGRLMHLSAWELVIDRLFDLRCQKECLYNIEETGALREFDLDIQARLQNVPEEFRQHLAWLPGLVPRLALVLHLLGARRELISTETIERAIALARWFGAAHLRALVSALPLPPKTDDIDAAASAAITDAETVMLRKIRTKEPVSRRQLWRSYDKPRAAVFDKTLDALLQSGKVRWNGQKELVTTA